MTISEIQSTDAAALAERIARGLMAAIDSRGHALIAVSGGRSPVPLFETLSRARLDWARVTVTLVDERWVSADHPDSNERLVRKHLLKGAAAAARFVGMKNDAPDPYRGQAECARAIAALPRPFDIMLLGMGADGHTASLFPGAPELEDGLTTSAPCLATTPPDAPHPRMTLSLAAILASRMIILPIAGAAKLAVYRAALGHGPVAALPIRAVLRQPETPIEVWIS